MRHTEGDLGHGTPS